VVKVKKRCGAGTGTANAGLRPSTSYSIISSHSHYLLFATHGHTIATCFAVAPRLCLFLNLSQLITWKSICYLNATHPPDHSHLCSLKCHHIFFPYRPGLTSMQHTASHTAEVHLAINYRTISACKQQQQQRPFNGLRSGTTRVGRYQKKHSPTHSHPDHRASFIIFLHLQRSMASSLFFCMQN